MNAPYAPYSPKRHPTSSTLSTSTSRHDSLSPAPTLRATQSYGFVRPGATTPSLDSPTIRSPKPTLPPSGWNGTITTSSAHASPTPSPGPSGFGGGGRPPPSPSFAGGSSMPFQSVPSGSSPFPPGSPNPTGSPSQQQQQHQRGGTTPNGNGGQRGERVRAPYHSSFQPQGVRRDRTEDFLAKRKARSEGNKLEEGRLGRRMEKLVELHFPLPGESSEKVIPPPPTLSRSSTLASLSEFGGSLRGKNAKDLWRSVAGGPSEAERAEQSIVKWQEDSEATRCPICMAAFGLKTRRHHCRLCGRVVCFLPPTPPVTLPPPSINSPPPIPTPTRRERCSTFFTYEYEGMIIDGEKKPVGVVVEIESVEQDLSFGGMAEDVAGSKEKDARKKVRVCRECLNVVMRQQEKTLPTRTPTWLKLYQVLVQIEKEIEESLPQFQELVIGLQKPAITAIHPSAAAAQALRKRLLTNLASYDTISKRIRDLPLSDGDALGGSRERLQHGISARAMLFLSEKLSLLRSLGNIEDDASGKNKKKQPAKNDKVTTLASLLGREGVDGKDGGRGSPAPSGQLAVLLEQEALVAGYVEDARARRQFEDAVSLQASLDELRVEIERVRLAG